MNNFYVDYENVTTSGLNGIEKLSEQDNLTILYSDRANSVPMTLIEMFRNSKCKIDFIRMEKTAPNYLDFHLVCEVASFLAENPNASVCIVSHDKGYISCRDYFSKKNREVTLVGDIAEYFNKKPIAGAVENVKPVKVVEKAGKEEDITVIKVPEFDKPSNEHTKNKTVPSFTKEEIRKQLDGLNKRNGLLHNTVYSLFEKTKTLDEYCTGLKLALGIKDGQRAFDRTKDLYKTFWGV